MGVRSKTQTYDDLLRTISVNQPIALFLIDTLTGTLNSFNLSTFYHDNSHVQSQERGFWLIGVLLILIYVIDVTYYLFQVPAPWPLQKAKRIVINTVCFEYIIAYFYSIIKYESKKTINRWAFGFATTIWLIDINFITPTIKIINN